MKFNDWIAGKLSSSLSVHTYEDGKVLFSIRDNIGLGGERQTSFSLERGQAIKVAQAILSGVAETEVRQDV